MSFGHYAAGFSDPPPSFVPEYVDRYFYLIRRPTPQLEFGDKTGFFNHTPSGYATDDLLVVTLKAHDMCVIKRCYMEIPRETAKIIYKEHAGRPYHERLVRHMTGKAFGLLIYCNSAKMEKELISLVGKNTNPEEYDFWAPGTLRRIFGYGVTGEEFNRHPFNGIHLDEVHDEAVIKLFDIKRLSVRVTDDHC